MKRIRLNKNLQYMIIGTYIETVCIHEKVLIENLDRMARCLYEKESSFLNLIEFNEDVVKFFRRQIIKNKIHRYIYKYYKKSCKGPDYIKLFPKFTKYEAFDEDIEKPKGLDHTIGDKFFALPVLLEIKLRRDTNCNSHHIPRRLLTKKNICIYWNCVHNRIVWAKFSQLDNEKYLEYISQCTK